MKGDPLEHLISMATKEREDEIAALRTQARVDYNLLSLLFVRGGFEFS